MSLIHSIYLNVPLPNWNYSGEEVRWVQNIGDNMITRAHIEFGTFGTFEF